jgi:hypothetical protein
MIIRNLFSPCLASGGCRSIRKLEEGSDKTGESVKRQSPVASRNPTVASTRDQFVIECPYSEVHRRKADKKQPKNCSRLAN